MSLPRKLDELKRTPQWAAFLEAEPGSPEEERLHTEMHVYLDTNDFSDSLGDILDSEVIGDE